MSWKPEIKVTNDPKFYQNGQTFATKQEALASAENRFYNWTMAEKYRAVEVDTQDNPVNYKWVDWVGDVRIDEKSR
jgi:hypothetical protein